jgi:serine/threonine protein phosphatase PrpC
MMDDDGIADVLAAMPDPHDAVDALVTNANLAGGKDNITVVMVRIDPAGAPLAGNDAPNA